MKRYIVRQEVFDGMNNFVTDIYVSEHSNLIDAYHDMSRHAKLFRIMGRHDEFFVWDRKEDKTFRLQTLRELYEPDQTDSNL